MNSAWTAFRYRLGFRIGELALFRVPLRVRQRVASLAELRAGTIDLPKLTDLGPDTCGFLLRSYPDTEAIGVGRLPEGATVYRMKRYEHCFVDLTIGFEAYQDKFSGKTRQGIRRKIKKFSEHCGGTLDIRGYRSPAELAEFYPLARQVSSLTYQERLLGCGLPDYKRYLSSLLDLAGADRVRAFLLFAGDRPVSYLLCPVREGIVEYAYLGYDPAYAEHSVGTVLLWESLKRLFDENRFQVFDFTEGESEHKRLYSTHRVECANILLLRPSLPLAMLCHAHFTTDRLSNVLGRVLERWGWKRQIKRWLRKVA